MFLANLLETTLADTVLFFIDCLRIGLQQLISNVLLCLIIDRLYYLLHILRNLKLAANQYVLVEDNKVCSFGVVRNLPFAFKVVDQL